MRHEQDDARIDLATDGWSPDYFGLLGFFSIEPRIDPAIFFSVGDATLLRSVVPASFSIDFENPLLVASPAASRVDDDGLANKSEKNPISRLPTNVTSR